MGIAFPMAEVISTYIPPSFYEVSYDACTIEPSYYATVLFKWRHTFDKGKKKDFTVWFFSETNRQIWKKNKFVDSQPFIKRS